MCSANVASQNSVRVVVNDHFHQSVGLAHCNCFAIAAEECFLGCEIQFSRLALLFGGAYHCKFGSGEYCRGHHIEASVAVATGDVINHDRCLCGCGVREHATRVHVANGVNARDRRHHVVIYNDCTSLDCYSQLLCSLRDYRFASHCH